MVFVTPPGSSSPTSSNAVAVLQVTCMATPAVAGSADHTLSKRPAWPLQTTAAFAAFYVFVYHDLIDSVIFSSPTTSTPTTANDIGTFYPKPIGAATVVESSSASPSDTGVWFMVVPAPARTVLATPVCAFVPDVSPSLASSGRRLVFIGFDNVLGMDSLLYDCLDYVTEFFYAYSALAKPEYAFVPDVRLVLAKLWMRLVLDGSYCIVSGIGILDDCLDASPSSSRALCACGFMCVYLDTGNPTTTSTTATPIKAEPPNALGSLDIGTKGYHLA